MPKDILSSLSIMNAAAKFKPELRIPLQNVQRSIDILMLRIRALGGTPGRGNTLGFGIDAAYITGLDVAVASVVRQGIQPQPLATATRSLAGTGTTNIVNYTGTGMLISVGIQVTVAVTGTPTCVLRYTIDGGPAQDIPLYTAATTFDTNTFTISGSHIGTGSAIGEQLNFVEGFGFNRSLQVDMVVTGAGATGTILGVAKYGIATN